MDAPKRKGDALADRVKKYFGKVAVAKLVSAEREFPMTVRVDLQGALSRILEANFDSVELLGFQQPYRHNSPAFASLVTKENHPAVIAPLRHEDMDAGDAMPVRNPCSINFSTKWTP